MERIAKTKFQVLIVMLFFPFCIKGQHSAWIPRIDSVVITVDKRIRHHPLSHYLSRSSVNLVEKSDEGKRVGVFYFRVDHKRNVDSLFYQGDLPGAIPDSIKARIYLTNKQWKSNRRPRRRDSCWFVYVVGIATMGNNSGLISQLEKLEPEKVRLKSFHEDLMHELGKFEKVYFMPETINVKNGVILKPVILWPSPRL